MLVRGFCASFASSSPSSTFPQEHPYLNLDEVSWEITNFQFGHWVTSACSVSRFAIILSKVDFPSRLILILQFYLRKMRRCLQDLSFGD